MVLVAMATTEKYLTAEVVVANSFIQRLMGPEYNPLNLAEVPVV